MFGRGGQGAAAGGPRAPWVEIQLRLLLWRPKFPVMPSGGLGGSVTDYAFETITAAQALAITFADRVTVASGSARQTTVLFLADGTFSVTIEARNVVFGAGFAELSRSSGMVYPDGSRLYVGTAATDTRDFNVGTVSTGAIYAGDGDDTFTSGDGTWLLQGNQGGDALLIRSPYSNTVYGGQGNDTISTVLVGGTPQVGQFAQGNRGDDLINGSNAGDTLLGGQGNDRIFGNLGQDFINGNLGDDNIFGDGQLFGEGGNDTLSAGTTAASTVQGGDGNDRIVAAGLIRDGVHFGVRNVLMGEAGADTVDAVSPEHDEIFGGDGDDLLSNANTIANAGDLMDGGAGNDTVLAQVGDDTLRGGDGNDSLNGGAGVNHLEGGIGDDYLLAPFLGEAHVLDGGQGDDSLFGGLGSDTISGGGGNDRISDHAGDGARIDAGDGDDRVTASGRGTVFGGEGADTIDTFSLGQSISGGGGADSLHGSSRADTLTGDAGDDVIDAGIGADVLFGGAGADSFLLFGRDGPPQLGSAARIGDWSSEDRIRFAASFSEPPTYIEATAQDFQGAVSNAQTLLTANENAVVAIQLGADVIVFSGRTVGTTDTAVVLVGRTLNDISASNIL